MSRFLWKIVSLLVVVAGIPVALGVIVVNELVQETVAIGMDDRVKASLDRATLVHRHYIALRRENIELWASDLAHDRALLSALGDDQRSREVLKDRARDASSPEQGIVAISVSGASRVAIDHTDRYPEDKWRIRRVERKLKDADGNPWTLRATVAVPWSVFREYQALGEVQKTFHQMEERQAVVSRAYTTTFVAFSAVGLLLAIVLGVLLARTTTVRLRRLHGATALVAAGDLDIRLKVEGRDEIADLMHGFNRMVGELQQSRERVVWLERVSAWQEIAQRLAHEIKNPLTPILLSVQQLDRKVDQHRDDFPRYRALVAEALEIVTEEVGALRKLVGEFSDFARLPRVEAEPAEIRQFVSDVLKTSPQFTPYLAPYHIDGPPIFADIDATLMRRCLDNLLQNAADAVSASETPRENSIEVSVVVRGPQVILRIKDKGPGIDPNDIDRLFQPYFTTKENGTGLGLPIVKKTVFDHGGDVRVTSPAGPEGGTVLEILLPVTGDP
jgi:nitrogen fixation/metabolism regulation signal transduction histidine kinase